jgi:hypothetical protein
MVLTGDQQGLFDGELRQSRSSFEDASRIVMESVDAYRYAVGLRTFAALFKEREFGIGVELAGVGFDLEGAAVEGNEPAAEAQAQAGVEAGFGAGRFLAPETLKDAGEFFGGKIAASVGDADGGLAMGA